MAGLHTYPARRDEGLSALEVSRPAFILYSPDYGALHRATHGLPRYRWTGVQDGIGVELGQKLTGRMHGHQVRSSRIDTLQRLLISGIYW
jgi:hypothetical protein